jgi:hypothetical protein
MAIVTAIALRGALPRAEAQQNFELTAGDDASLSVTVRDRSTGDAVDLTGCTAAWVASRGSRRLLGDDCLPADPIVSKTGTLAGDPSTGVFTVALDPADTASLRAGDYRHQARLTDADGNTVAVMSGRLRIREDIA